MNGTMLPNAETVNAFRDLLEVWHRGEENAIKSRVIEQRFSVRGEEVRAVVNHWNARGVWLASSCKGYFFAVTEQEKAAYRQNLEARIKGIRNRLEGLTQGV